jgi:hypothetical protein
MYAVATVTLNSLCAGARVAAAHGFEIPTPNVQDINVVGRISRATALSGSGTLGTFYGFLKIAPILTRWRFIDPFWSPIRLM